MLSIFDNPKNCEEDVKFRKKVITRSQVIYQNHQANIIDDLDIIKDMWENDETCYHHDGIKRCWRKADILPPTMIANLKNDVGCSPCSKQFLCKISEGRCDE